MSTWPLEPVPGLGRVRESVIARNLVFAAVGGVLIATVEFAYMRNSTQLGAWLQLAWLGRLAVHWSIGALPLGLLLGFAERHAAPRAPSMASYGIVVLAGAVTGGIVIALHSEYIDPTIATTAVGLDLSLPDRFLYGFWQLGFWGTVGMVLHATDQQQRRSAQSLRDVELVRLRSERVLTEVRLAAIHARVEPEFVLRSLDAVARLYARDVPAADRALDALIRFLREATPLLRQSESSVAGECHLLESYWRALATPPRAADDLCLDVDPEADEAWLPPGLLISLVQQVLDVQPTATVRVEVRASVDRALPILHVHTSAFGEDCLRTLREFAARATPRLISPGGPRGHMTILPYPSGLVVQLTFSSEKKEIQNGRNS
jgi:hypothetical protein